MAHQKPNQLNRFVNQILEENINNDVYIHINKKCENIIDSINKGKRIFISDERFKSDWGKDSFLKAILNMFQQVVNSGVNYDYVILCSGQDLLVKKGLDAFLEEHFGEMFIECDGSNIAKNDAFRRATLLHKFPDILRNKYDFKFHPLKIYRSLLLRFYQKHPKVCLKKIEYDVSNITFYYDKFWQITPFDLVRYILFFLQENPNFWSIYEGGFIADESFFSTIILNSKYKDRIHFNNGFSKSYTYVSKIVNGHPTIITIKDVGFISDSGCFLARKFDDNVDKSVIDYYCGLFD